MAFTNAFLGINHSMAHKLCGEFHIPHGRANGVLLPHVIKYNSQLPTKFAIFPKYGTFQADYRYAQISRQLNLGGTTQEEQIDALIAAVRDLMKKLNLPMTIRDCGNRRANIPCEGSGLAERAT